MGLISRGEQLGMIRVRLKQMLDEKAFKEGRRITLAEVSEQTGISTATLTRVANRPGYNTNTDTINALCRFLDCEPGELLQYVADRD